jgi:hypothetical protein
MPSPQKDKVECVGSLLVSTHDVQDLSDAPEVHIPSFPEGNLKRRVTAGTLLVSSTDLKTPAGEESDPKQDGPDTSGATTLRKRITNRLNGPAPEDSEADSWAD